MSIDSVNEAHNGNSIRVLEADFGETLTWVFRYLYYQLRQRIKLLDQS